MSLKGYELILHDEAFKEKENLGKIFNHSDHEPYWRGSSRHPLSDELFICLKGLITYRLTYVWCLKEFHSPTLILFFDCNLFLKFRIVCLLEKVGFRYNYVFESSNSLLL